MLLLIFLEIPQRDQSDDACYDIQNERGGEDSHIASRVKQPSSYWIGERPCHLPAEAAQADPDHPLPLSRVVGDEAVRHHDERQESSGDVLNRQHCSQPNPSKNICKGLEGFLIALIIWDLDQESR